MHCFVSEVKNAHDTKAIVFGQLTFLDSYKLGRITQIDKMLLNEKSLSEEIRRVANSGKLFIGFLLTLSWKGAII